MWLFTRSGFVSIVGHRYKLGDYLVRARTREHLTAFLRPEEELPAGAGLVETIEETRNADYRFRVRLSAPLLRALVACAVHEALEYSDFKSSLPHDTAAQNAYADACSGVWSTMHQLQRGGRYASGMAGWEPLPAYDVELCDDCGADPDAEHYDWCRSQESLDLGGQASSGPTLDASK